MSQTIIPTVCSITGLAVIGSLLFVMARVFQNMGGMAPEAHGTIFSFWRS